MIRPPPTPPLLPYTTLSRSHLSPPPAAALAASAAPLRTPPLPRSEEHTSELQSLRHLVCRLLLEKKTFGYVTRTPAPRYGGERLTSLMRTRARIFFFLMIGRPPGSTFFPYATLFR